MSKWFSHSNKSYTPWREGPDGRQIQQIMQFSSDRLGTPENLRMARKCLWNIFLSTNSAQFHGNLATHVHHVRVRVCVS